MTRYILIDNHSGYIFGDSGDLDGPARDETAIEFAKRLDNRIGVFNRTYEVGDRRSSDTGYHVYIASHSGSEAVPLVHDGQSRDEIDAVEANCLYGGFIRCWFEPEQE